LYTDYSQEEVDNGCLDATVMQCVERVSAYMLAFLSQGHNPTVPLTVEEHAYVRAVLANPAGLEAERHMSNNPELLLVANRSIDLGLMTEV
ncbi:hypothetical protein KIPB_006298, partial [Kipferlia bialata]